MLKKLCKLIKYEFLHYARVMPFLYVAAIVLALVPSLETLLGFEQSGSVDMVLSVFIVAMVTVGIVQIVQRFRKNLLDDPGYLMFTLPVPAHLLLGSVAIAAFCVMLLSFAFAMAAVLLRFAVWARQQGDERSFGEIVRTLAGNALGGTSSAMAVAGFLSGTLSGICLAYLAITASRLLPRFRMLAAIVAYIAVGGFAGWLTRLLPGDGGGVSVVIANVALGALYFLLTGFLFRRTLNLE